jgi:hypothetical protein
VYSGTVRALGRVATPRCCMLMLLLIVVLAAQPGHCLTHHDQRTNPAITVSVAPNGSGDDLACYESASSPMRLIKNPEIGPACVSNASRAAVEAIAIPGASGMRQIEHSGAPRGERSGKALLVSVGVSRT